MRAIGLLLMWTGACSVSPDLSALGCPCGPGFRCVADRCVEGDEGNDAGRDSGSDARMADAPGLLDAGERDIGVSPDDAGPGGPLSFAITQTASTGTNVFWVDGEVEIDVSPGAGVVESEIFDAGRAARWTRFEWLPSGPYGRPFAAEPEPVYESGSVPHVGLSLMMPFDAPLGDVEGMEYVDISSAGRMGRVVGTRATSIEGVFGQAFAATDTSWVSVPMTGNLFPATSEHTLSFWARSRQSCLGRVRVFIGSEGEGPDKSHVWIGCWNGGTCDEGSIGGVWSSDGTSSVPRLCSQQDANDGEWHHIAVRKSGTHDEDAIVEIFFDGEAISTTNIDYTGTTFRFSANEDLWFGHFFNGGYPTTVDLDEAAFFSRALDEDEIALLHSRGRLDAEFEIRVCDEASCSDGTWTNLEGGAGTSGDRPGISTLPLAYDMNFTGRYAQIRATLTSTDPSSSPEIGGMRLVAE